MDSPECTEEFLEAFANTLRRPIPERTMGTYRGECGLLMYLCNRHNGASAGELSEFLDVGSGRIANALKDLENKGLIVRDRCPEDKRQVLVHLTDKGKAYVEEKHREILERAALLIRELGEHDARVFITLLKRVMEISDRRLNADALS
jgi:DNA-binding MarR family transcriptional regulator